MVKGFETNCPFSSKYCNSFLIFVLKFVSPSCFVRGRQNSPILENLKKKRVLATSIRSLKLLISGENVLFQLFMIIETCNMHYSTELTIYI